MKKLLSALLVMMMLVACMAPALADEGSEPDWTHYDELIAEIKSTTDVVAREALMHEGFASDHVSGGLDLRDQLIVMSPIGFGAFIRKRGGHAGDEHHHHQQGRKQLFHVSMILLFLFPKTAFAVLRVNSGGSSTRCCGRVRFRPAADIPWHTCP